MRRRTAGLAIAAALLSAQFPSAGAVGAAPVLVELFTSEGCSSCPPADGLLARLADTAGITVIPLGEHVDYWDQLGWRDRFSSAAATARQQVYARRFGGDGPYTPQLVVDGRAECVGSDAPSAQRAIAAALTRPHGSLTIAVGARHDSSVDIAVTAAGLPQKPNARADVLLAVTEDGLRSAVTAGENRGHVLAHVAVVRRLAKIGEATGTAASLTTTATIAPDWRRDALHLVAFVQERGTGAVLGAATVSLVRQ